MAPPDSNPGRPVVAALAVLIADDAVLLVRRANPPDATLWGFPGGKVELGETVEQAAIRELQEETGVQAQALEPFTAIDAFERDSAGALQRHHVLIAVGCCHVSGTPQAASDALEACWIPLSELDGIAAETSARVVEVARMAARHRLSNPGRTP